MLVYVLECFINVLLEAGRMEPRDSKTLSVEKRKNLLCDDDRQILQIATFNNSSEASMLTL